MGRSNINTAIKLFADVFYILFCIAGLLLKVLIWILKQFFKLIFLIFKSISFKKSKYKEKSGNNLLQVAFNDKCVGEYKLYKELIKHFDENCILTNIYLPSKNTTHTEIDLLAVSQGKIYCFEVKNYSGSIYGKENDENWTQVLSFKFKKKFYNPIKQNYAHMKALESYLGMRQSDINPFVVFTGSAKIDNVSTLSKVIKLSDLKSSLDKKYGYNDGDKEIISKLMLCCNVDESIKKQHIKEVKKLQKIS